MISAPTVSTMKMYREYSPRYKPNAAPLLRTSVRRSVSPMTDCGENGGSEFSAIIFVTTSATTMNATTGQNTTALGPLLLGIFLALLALDAVPRMRERIEPLERNLLTTVVAFPERLGCPVQSSERCVDVPEEAAFLAREQERLLALHGVRALVGHVERVGAQVTIRRLWRGPERLVVMAKLLKHSAALLEQALLEVLEILLVHAFRLLRAAGGWHRYWSLVRASRTTDPSGSSARRLVIDRRFAEHDLRASNSLATQSWCPETPACTSAEATIHTRIWSLTAKVKSPRNRCSCLNAAAAGAVLLPNFLPSDLKF